jgi:4'-phosphopantetheinyl transferase
MKPDFHWQNIVENFFAPGEIARLHALSNDVQHAAFFACWTRKESYIKAKGGGLSIPLREFEVSVDPGGPAVLLACSKDMHEVKRWALASLEVGPRYAAAVCVEAPLGSLQHFIWNPGASPV